MRRDVLCSTYACMYIFTYVHTYYVHSAGEDDLRAPPTALAVLLLHSPCPHANIVGAAATALSWTPKSFFKYSVQAMTSALGVATVSQLVPGVNPWVLTMALP